NHKFNLIGVSLTRPSTKVIDAKQFTAVARPGCARVFLPAEAVTARHTVSGELSCSAVATTPDTDRRDETG
ncbi:MAG: hypothetical protein ACE10B_00865, partial [Phycisphaerales bacterium]